jgi:hypothetical protein
MSTEIANEVTADVFRFNLCAPAPGCDTATPPHANSSTLAEKEFATSSSAHLCSG